MKKSKKNKKQFYVGQVMSDKMEKTIVVKTTRTVRHPLFHKIMRKSEKYKVHDEQGIAKPGDLVEFFEGRPLSKTKYMYLARVIKEQPIK